MCAAAALNAPRLAEENEMLRALLQRIHDEYVTHGKGNVYRLHVEDLEDIRAALAGREEGK
jgi:hypothetical protein